MKRFLVCISIIGAIVFSAACSNQRSDELIPMVHIHGLAYTKDGERLLVPVHAGLAVYENGKWAQGQGELHDYMGFTASDEGFYSSGHPALGSDYSNPLGLVKSTNEGKSITVLALEGEVDLHGLGVGYKSHTLYALNPHSNSKMSQVGLYYSEDEGKNWTNSSMLGIQEQIAAIAVHPEQSSVVALGTEAGAYISQDYGNTFTLIGPNQPVSALAFTMDGELLVATVGPNFGFVKINIETKQSADITSPVQAGDVMIYMAQNPVNKEELAVATDQKNIYISKDTGVTWQQIVNNGEYKS